MTLKLNIGATKRLHAECTYQSNLTDEHVIWESGDPLIAEVDPYGLVTGISGGGVTIYAKGKFDRSISDSIQILVGESVGSVHQTTYVKTWTGGPDDLTSSSQGFYIMDPNSGVINPKYLTNPELVDNGITDAYFYSLRIDNLYNRLGDDTNYVDVDYSLRNLEVNKRYYLAFDFGNGVLKNDTYISTSGGQISRTNLKNILNVGDVKAIFGENLDQLTHTFKISIINVVPL